ncbi:hypothetical protein HOD38_05335 [archaeon]|nr:hypothetical protein [archaeon]MBT4397663.1 hypothetical protein [archaeon]MBT4441641.1 hypothetical protein [archaeon]
MKGKFSNRSLLPFVLIIVVLIVLLFFSLFLSQSSILSREVGFSQSELNVNEVLVKVMLKQGDFFERSIQITNDGGSAESVSVSISGLEDLLYLDENSFTIEQGQVKTLDLNFVSVLEGSYFDPGVYIGGLNFQYGEEEVSLPIIVEIESSETLFDMNLDFSVNDRYVVLGGTALADITVYNFAELDLATVDMVYVVSDANGNRLLTEEENLVVETQASVSKSIFVPDNFAEGKYIFYSTVSYGDSVGTASYIFDVASGEPDSKLNLGSICAPEDPLCWISLVILIILIFFIGAYAYFYLGSFLYKKVSLDEKKITDKKVRKQGPILYFFVLLVIIILVIVMFYLSNFMSIQSLVGSFSNMPVGVLWAILILLALMVVLVILNTVFGLLNSLSNYFSKSGGKEEERRKSELVKEIIERRRKVELRTSEESLRKQEVPEKKEGSFFTPIKLYFADRRKEKEKRRKAAERKRALMRREEEMRKQEQERMRLAAERKRVLEIKRREAAERRRKEEAAKKKKVGVFASISGYFARRKKEKERKRNLELKNKKEEHSKKSKEELRKDREIQLSLQKEWDVNEGRRKVEERKVRAAEIELEKAERNKQMQIEREIQEVRLKKKEDKRRKKEKKKLERVRKKRRKGPLFGFGGKKKAREEVKEVKKKAEKTIDVKSVDPREKIVQLMKNCSLNIKRRNYLMAESNYEQIKPMYAKLNSDEQRYYYPNLVRLQNQMVMLKMELVREKLQKRRFRV